MASILERGNNLPTEVVRDMFNAVRGHSALAKLSAEDPIPFNGATEFVFSMDKEVDIVAENGAKSNGGGTATPVTIVPVKFEYGMRVSDEFMRGSEEAQLDIIERFAEGFSRKVARGLDIAGFHGLNPRTGQASTVVGDNSLDGKVVNAVAYSAQTPADELLDSAVALIADGDINGVAMAPAFAQAMAGIKANGVPQYPEFRFGRNPEDFYGMKSDVNSTVIFGGNTQYAYVGDFANAFKWGYAENVPLKVIEYGNPDNDAQLGDLQGHNQVYLRCEAYIGWGILDPGAFAIVGTGADSE